MYGGKSRSAYILQMLKPLEENDESSRSYSAQQTEQPSCSYAVQRESAPDINKIVFIEQDEEFYDSDADPAYKPSSSSSDESMIMEHVTVIRTEAADAESNTVDPNKLDLKQKRVRSKRRAPETWIKTVRKQKRNSGLSYTTTSKKMRLERKSRNIGIECPCLRKCHLAIPDEGKSQICSAFWQLGDLNRQRDFIASNVIRQKSVRGRAENSRRHFSLMYFLKFEEKKTQVCKNFFLQTLDISEKMMRTALEKASRNVTNIPSPDYRGKHRPGVKHTEQSIEFAENHIDSFPRVPSHWCRKDTKKDYLESILNKEKMYSLYKEKCTEVKVKPISITSYRELLIKKNIGFHIPKKDQCWCLHFEQLPENEQSAEKLIEYQLHIRRKMAAMEEKKSDALKAKEDNSYISANFDLEAVLYSPLLFAKPVFYKRKLATFSFTVYETAKQQGHCFVWPEYEGNRGANEVSTCLSKFIQSLPKETRHLVLHSDCCPGQNRNSIVACMLLEAVKNTDLQIIDLKFLEPGHTHMECDSMHATIERASEYTKIYWPNDWINVLRLANKKKPYNVRVMEHTDFLNYKELKEKLMINTKKSEGGENVNWKEIKWLRFEKEKNNYFQYKNEYWDEFKSVNITRKGRVSKKVSDNSSVNPLYSSCIPLKKKKFVNLQEMCNQKDAVIPQQYHHFYQSLPVERNDTEQSESDDEISLQTLKEKLRRRKTRRNF